MQPAGMQIEVKSMSQSDKIQLFEDKRIRTAWIEERTGVPVITAKNAAQLNQVVTDRVEGAAAAMSGMPEEK